MHLQFDGFQSSFPLLFLTGLLVGLALLAWWSYSHSNETQPFWRWTLIGLRTLSLWLLLLLLLNPVFLLHESRRSSVKLALLYDNSLSTTIEKGLYEGESTYRALMQILDNSEGSLLEGADVSVFGFDNDVVTVESSQELILGGTRTNLDNALMQLRDMMDGHDAVIMITDGIITSGRDPGATAAAYPVPVYTVGIGDTIRLNDLAIRQVTYPTSASLNSSTRIQATIYNEGFPDEDIAVQLRNPNGVLDEVIIRSGEQRSVQQVRFDVQFREEGLQLFDIHIPSRPGEWTTDNNTYPFSIDVRDDRLRILHLAYEVHPDVGQIRSFLERDEQLNLVGLTWLGEDRYFGGTLSERPDTLDLVILHGFPNSIISESEARSIADRFSGNALMIVGSPGQDVSLLSRLFAGQLPLRFEPGFSWNSIQFQVSEQNQGHAILDFSWPDEMQPTPVRGPVRHVAPTEGAQVLLHSVYRGSLMTAPLLAVRTPDDRNISYLNGFHFYEWAMSTRPELREFWENLLNNTVKWTAASPDEQLLRITTSQPEYETGESVILNARLNNEAGDPEPDASITLVIIDENNHDRGERRFIMENEGGGFYRLELEQLPAGQWQFTATASRSDRVLDTRSGSFSVSEVVREFVNTIRNEELLRQVAILSSGAYVPYETIGILRDIIERDIGFEERTERVSHSFPINRHPFWFILVLILLTAEWGVRKYRSMA